MTTRPVRFTLFALYRRNRPSASGLDPEAVHQLSVLLGVLLMPVALLAHRLGVPIPFERLLSGLGERVD